VYKPGQNGHPLVAITEISDLAIAHFFGHLDPKQGIY